MRTLLKFVLLIFLLLLVIATSTMTSVDRAFYMETTYYREMNKRLDSLGQNLQLLADSSVFEAGWAAVNITPQKSMPLAGYGARNPKEFSAIHDSSFVRTVAFRNGQGKLAVVACDLLIVHPQVSQAVWAKLPEGWKKEEIYFTATHTHSGVGGWAPGIVGELFAGVFHPEIVEELAGQIVGSIREATSNLDTAAIAFAEINLPDLVKNRLVKKQGVIDPWFKTLHLQQADGERGLMSFYSAHATCLGHENRELSGDFPSAYHQLMGKQGQFDFVSYAAGAVGSMGPNVNLEDDWLEVEFMAQSLVEQVNLLQMIGSQNWQQPEISSFYLKLPLPEPQFKISKDIALRPYLFEWAFGDYEHFITVARLGRVLMIGLPCDFSGELAVPLYEYARSLGLQLIVTSFNGDYAGYIIKDEWYDLSRYEARTMSWYGPEAGAYLTEVITRIIDIIVHED